MSRGTCVHGFKKYMENTGIKTSFLARERERIYMGVVEKGKERKEERRWRAWEFG